MKCEHSNYDDYFERCEDCGATAEQITALENIAPEVREALETLVYEREFNPKHEDDYFNAGGFGGHWTTYTTDEKIELMTEVLCSTH